MDFAVFLGSSHTVVYKKNQGIVLNEATSIAYTFGGKNNKEINVVAVGNAAKKLQDKVDSSTIVVSPIGDGRIGDLNLAKLFFKEIFKKVSTGFNQSCLFCIPCSLSAEELEDYKSVAYSTGLTNVCFVPNVITSAINLGLSADDGTATLSVCISESGTDIAVITKGGIINGGTIEEGGMTVTYAIKDWILKKYKILISDRVSLDARNETATLLVNDESLFKIHGVDIENGTAREVVFTGIDCQKILVPVFNNIAKAILQVLSECSPDVINDIRARSVFVGVGAGKITGLKEFLTNNLDMNVTLNEDSFNSAINGAGKLLSDKVMLNKIIKAN